MHSDQQIMAVYKPGLKCGAVHAVAAASRRGALREGLVGMHTRLLIEKILRDLSNYTVVALLPRYQVLGSRRMFSNV